MIEVLPRSVIGSRDYTSGAIVEGDSDHRYCSPVLPILWDDDAPPYDCTLYQNSRPRWTESLSSNSAYIWYRHQ